MNTYLFTINSMLDPFMSMMDFYIIHNLGCLVFCPYSHFLRAGTMPVSLTLSQFLAHCQHTIDI